MEDEAASEFSKQFSGSAAANGITVLILGVLYALKKCLDRPSRCKSKFHSCCLDIEVSDKSQTSRGAAPISKDGPEGTLV